LSESDLFYLFIYLFTKFMSEHRYSKITQQNYTTVQNTKFATYAASYTYTKYNKKNKALATMWK